MSVKEAFACFNAVPAARNSWSALARDRKGAVVTMWEDLIVDETYDVFNDGELHKWREAPGNIERTAVLRFIRDRCAGRFRVVRLTTAKTDCYPREVLYAVPDEREWMLVALNEETGEFRAEAVSRSSAV